MIDHFVMALIAATGLTLIVVRGKIFEPQRLWLMSQNKTLAYAINCPQCMGFWIGLFYGAITYWDFYFIAATACSVSLTAMLADRYYFFK